MPELDRARKCVVYIGLLTESGNFVPYGTGFLMSIFHEEIQFDYVITCHHIIQMFDDDNTWIRVNLNTGDCEVMAVPKNLWFNDIKNDISVFSRHFGRDKYSVTRIIDKNINTLLDRIKADQEPPIAIGWRIFLVGLLTSHYGNVHNTPILRMGHIAALPDEQEPIDTDTGFVKAYLIETRSIGGLSGSPVFHFDAWCGYDMQYPIPGGLLEACFLGMMRGRFNTKDPNDVVRSEIQSDKELKEIIDQLTPELKKAFLGLMGKRFLVDDINTGIGIVIPADVIVEFINQPAFVAQREETVKELKKKTHYRNSAATPDTENPRHKEDFNSLVSAATKKKLQDD